MSKIVRYSGSDRVNHWLVALLFVLAAISGLAFFHPSLFFLSNVLGGGQLSRILHPFIGVAMFVLFVISTSSSGTTTSCIKMTVNG